MSTIMQYMVFRDYDLSLAIRAFGTFKVCTSTFKMNERIISIQNNTFYSVTLYI